MKHRKSNFHRTPGLLYSEDEIFGEQYTVYPNNMASWCDPVQPSRNEIAKWKAMIHTKIRGMVDSIGFQ